MNFTFKYKKLFEENCEKYSNILTLFVNNFLEVIYLVKIYLRQKIDYF